VEVKVARGDEIVTVPFVAGEHPVGRKETLQALGPGSLLPGSTPASP
jgi:hypothetical protein